MHVMRLRQLRLRHPLVGVWSLFLCVQIRVCFRSFLRLLKRQQVALKWLLGLAVPETRLIKCASIQISRCTWALASAGLSPSEFGPASSAVKPASMMAEMRERGPAQRMKYCKYHGFRVCV